MKACETETFPVLVADEADDHVGEFDGKLRVEGRRRETRRRDEGRFGGFGGAVLLEEEDEREQERKGFQYSLRGRMKSEHERDSTTRTMEDQLQLPLLVSSFTATPTMSS